MYPTSKGTQFCNIHLSLKEEQKEMNKGLRGKFGLKDMPAILPDIHLESWVWNPPEMNPFSSFKVLKRDKTPNVKRPMKFHPGVTGHSTQSHIIQRTIKGTQVHISLKTQI